MDTHNLPEDCLPNYKQGIFDWKRRMGEHLAYHEDPLNKAVHIVCIPFILYGSKTKPRLIF